jgi:hypothetical protein
MDLSVTIRVTLACARQGLLSDKRGLRESTGTISGQYKAEPPARLRSAYILSMISCSLWNNGSKRARALSSISTLPESKKITLGSIQYIAKHDELLQPIVFNFIEYLTSTLCINLHLGYHCTRLPPSSSLPCASPLYLDSEYFSVSVLDSQSSDLPHSLPKNQRRAFGTQDSVSNQGPSQPHLCVAMMWCCTGTG